MSDKVFWIPGRLHVEDAAVDVDGVLVGMYGGKTLADYQAQHPDAQIITVDEFKRHHDAALKTAPEVITAEQFNDALEILPPLGWVRDGTRESFKLCEMYSGNITDIYARIGADYYRFRDVASLPHAEIMGRIAAHLATTTA